MRIVKIFFFLFAPFLILPFVSGCDSVGEDNGTLRLYLTDAPFPFDLVQEANVTFDRIQVVKSDGTDEDENGDDSDGEIDDDSDDSDNDNIITIWEGEETFNLLELQDGITAPLTEVELEPGTYSQVRVRVVDASIVLKGDEPQTFDLKIPSGSTSGLKIQLNNVVIEEGETDEVTLDFDVSESFVVQGNPDTPAGINGFIFKPVIKQVVVEEQD